jgi:hypothetical protein
VSVNASPQNIVAGDGVTLLGGRWRPSAVCTGFASADAGARMMRVPDFFAERELQFRTTRKDRADNLKGAPYPGERQRAAPRKVKPTVAAGVLASEIAT